MSDKDDDPPNIPDPQEITRKLSDFLKSNFGDQVSFTNVSEGMNPFATMEDDGGGEDHDLRDPLTEVLDFDLIPRQIKDHLDRFVIRQDEAKKALSIAVCDHYNHVKHRHRLMEESPDEVDDLELRQAECHHCRTDWCGEDLPCETHC